RQLVQQRPGLPGGGPLRVHAVETELLPGLPRRRSSARVSSQVEAERRRSWDGSGGEAERPEGSSWESARKRGSPAGEGRETEKVRRRGSAGQRESSATRISRQ